MSRPQSVYLSKRAMSAVRQNDRLSPRLNQIIDRYMALIEPNEEYVREQFSIAEWRHLIAAYKVVGHWTAEQLTATVDLVCRAALADKAQQRIDALDFIDCIALVELLERDIAAEATPVPTQSEA